MKKEIIPDKIISGVLTLTAFLLPLFFTPFLADFFDLGKQMLLTVATSVVFLLMAIRLALTKKLVIGNFNFLLPLVVLAIGFWLSSAIASANFWLSAAGSLGAGGISLLVVVYLLFANYANRRLVILALLASGCLVSLSAIVFAVSRVSFPINIAALGVVIPKTWSFTGGLVTQAVLLVVALVISVGFVSEQINRKKYLKGGVFACLGLLVTAGLVATGYFLATIGKPVILANSSAWFIAVELLKNGKSALFGVGPNQFVTAFAAFKPMAFNSSEFWNLRFGTSSNWPLQLFTEVGLVGVGAYLVLTWQVVSRFWQAIREEKTSAFDLAVYFALVVVVVSQFLAPVNFSVLALGCILLALVSAGDRKEAVLDFTPMGPVAVLVLVLPLLLVVGLNLLVGRSALASYYYMNSIKAADKNDGVAVYNNQRQAILYDNSTLTYRLAYSQTNLQLANALASKQDVTEDDKTKISQLVQQAIEEAKAGVAADPRNVVAWENLAGIYQSLINFAKDSEQWAIAAYQQAINLDPYNPVLRVALGGLYFNQKNTDQAISLFAQAVQLKADYANAHYNLANALRERQMWAEAKSEYEAVLKLIPTGSEDYTKVSAELAEVAKNVPAVTPTPAAGTDTGAASQLSKPVPPPKGVNPPIELPDQELPISPVPTAEPTSGVTN